jgi:hypothetical protein
VVFAPLFAAGVGVAAPLCRNRGNAMALAGIFFVAIRSDLQRAQCEGFVCGWSAMPNMHRETSRSSDRHHWETLAIEALELGRMMPPGPARHDALKAASQLRCSADAYGIVFAKRGRPRK